MEEGVETAEQQAFFNVQACQALRGLLLDQLRAPGQILQRAAQAQARPSVFVLSELEQVAAPS
ncbi:hypothetical protein CXK96_10505 [Stutzerimonas stutzeri]|nr:hypothetical protein CXK96_10505 [Stutzerimonas stutzeri]